MLLGRHCLQRDRRILRMIDWKIRMQPNFNLIFLIQPNHRIFDPELAMNFIHRPIPSERSGKDRCSVVLSNMIEIRKTVWDSLSNNFVFPSFSTPKVVFLKSCIYNIDIAAPTILKPELILIFKLSRWWVDESVLLKLFPSCRLEILHLIYSVWLNEETINCWIVAVRQIMLRVSHLSISNYIIQVKIIVH